VTRRDYNKAHSPCHGIIMVCLFLIPSRLTVSGNFLLPHEARRQGTSPPFPRQHGEMVRSSSERIRSHYTADGDGRYRHGWTFYALYSTSFQQRTSWATGIGIFIAGFSSIFTGIKTSRQ